jgi:S1/P1 Nuclease
MAMMSPISPLALVSNALTSSSVGKSEEFWLNDLPELDTKPIRTAAMFGTPETWATESLLAARQAYQVPETGQRMKSGQKLGDAYVKANLPVVRQRLYRGSVRLATILNEAFDGK